MSKIKIFFSHSSDDESIVNTIDVKIRENNFLDTWFDKRSDTGINDGDHIDDRIRKGIQEEINYFVIFISLNSLISGWVSKELRLAFLRNKKTFKYNFIIPAFIDNEKRVRDIIKNAVENEKEGKDKIQDEGLKKIITQKSEKLNKSEDEIRTDLFENCNKLYKILGDQQQIRIDARLINKLEKLPENKKKEAVAEFEKTLHNRIANDFNSIVLGEKDKPLKFNTETANQFYETSKSYKRGVFFNVQIDLQEWFQPELQVHLALQKSIEDNINFQHINSCQLDPNDTNLKLCKSFIPTKIHSRIIFLKKTSYELHNLFKSDDNVVVNFRSFINMHNLMGSPLAIVPLDYFISIMIKHANFFGNKENAKILGFKNRNYTYNKDKKEKKPKHFFELLIEFQKLKNRSFNCIDRLNLTESEKKQKKQKEILKIKDELKLNRYNNEIKNDMIDFLENQSNFIGEIRSNIDFALFAENLDFKTPSIWCGSVSDKNEIYYYEVKEGESPNLINPTDGERFIKKENYLIKNDQTRFAILKDFAKIILSEVFTIEKFTQKLSENEQYKNRLNLNPKYNVFSEKYSKNGTQDILIKNYFSPWFYKFDKLSIFEEEFDEFLYFT